MKFLINSKKLNQTLTFSRPGKSYVYVDLNGEPGTLGNQLCSRGYLAGNTLAYEGDSYEAFEAKCRNWYRQYIKNRAERDL